MKQYVVSKTIDSEGKDCWYCHLKEFSYVPVFGSIGDKAKANRVCKMMNGKQTDHYRLITGFNR